MKMKSIIFLLVIVKIFAQDQTTKPIEPVQPLNPEQSLHNSDDNVFLFLGVLGALCIIALLCSCSTRLRCCRRETVMVVNENNIENESENSVEIV